MERGLNFVVKNKSKWMGFVLGLSVTLLLLVTISYRNINYQAVASIDYVYATLTEGDPEKSDTWLVEQYCNNKIALETGYPEMKEKCDYILSSQPEQ
jgi:hypothetical protein